MREVAVTLGEDQTITCPVCELSGLSLDDYVTHYWENHYEGPVNFTFGDKA